MILPVIMLFLQPSVIYRSTQHTTVQNYGPK